MHQQVLARQIYALAQHFATRSQEDVSIGMP